MNPTPGSLHEVNTSPVHMGGQSALMHLCESSWVQVALICRNRLSGA